MPGRRSALHEEVRPLVRRLARLYLVLDSVNALHRRLNGMLAGDRSEGWVYPNRLHALLAEDPERAVNPNTLTTVRTALDRLEAAQPELGEEADRRGESLRPTVIAALERQRARGHGDAGALREVANELRLPPAVLTFVADLPVQYGVAAVPVPAAHKSPDWSFQETAYRASLVALRRAPGRKVGLVIPTGGGKTRVAMRVILRWLADEPRLDSVALWVTHRRALRRQAKRELQRAVNAGTPDLPPDAVQLLAERVKIVLVPNLADALAEYGERVSLIAIDEAHHAAAPSYQAAVDHPAAGLFLTATPVRMDSLPIGIDEIAFTITYRELFRRGVIVEPSFEEPLEIGRVDWDDPDAETLHNLVDYVLDRAEDAFTKTLVIVSLRSHAERLYDLLSDELALRPAHVLDAEDVGFAHGAATSAGVAPEDFLDEFSARPRGVLVATAQLLSEGFDDPSINAVVMTYPTSSMVQLMQAAGRCLRSSPEKGRAYIVQARESALAYYFEQRWLYQDISDELRPQLIDDTYANDDDLRERVERLLVAHHCSPQVTATVLEAVDQVETGEEFSIAFTGLPYYGSPQEFDAQAAWGAVPVTAATRDLFLRIFNEFSARDADVRDHVAFLRSYLSDTLPNPRWSSFMDMLEAMNRAGRELVGEHFAEEEGRCFVPQRGTTWLKYATFRHHPVVPSELDAFLHDALNRTRVLAAYAERPQRWLLATKVPLPFTGTWAFLLDGNQAAWLEAQREALLAQLQDDSPLGGFGVLAAWRASLDAVPVPQLLVDQFDGFTAESRYSVQVLALGERDPAAGG